jgi:Na+/phosphate symporter
MAYDLFRQHTREGEKRFLGFAERCFEQLIEAFLNENLQQLRKQADAIEYKKHQLKKDKRIGTLAMRYLDTNTAIVKGGYYYQSTDLTYEIIKSLERICEPCREHIDNNFNPLADDQKSEFSQVSKEMTLFLNKSIQLIEENNYDSIEDVVLEGNMAINKLMVMKKSYLERIRIQACSARLGMVCLTVIQETQNIGAYTINLLKVNRKFQND